jgi:hypothetical protein
MVDACFGIMQWNPADPADWEQSSSQPRPAGIVSVVASRPEVGFAGRSKPRSQPSKLPQASSFSEIEIHRPSCFETPPDLQLARSTQYNANTGNDFRRGQRSETLSLHEQRDVEGHPAAHLPARISPATLAPLGLSHRPGLSAVWTA